MCPKRLAVSMLWESMQNLPVVCALVVAFRLWNISIVWSVICAIAGGLTSAIVIALTERKLDADTEYKEPPLTLIGNAFAMSVGIIITILYQHAQWSGWLTDMLIGSTLAGGLAVLQDITGHRNIEWLHALSLTLTGALFLPAFRACALLPWPIAAIGLTLLMSTAIVIIEYKPFMLKDTE